MRIKYNAVNIYCATQTEATLWLSNSLFIFK